MNTEYFISHPSNQPPPSRSRSRSRSRTRAGHPRGAGSGCSAGRHPRALSSPARSSAASPECREMRPRSPSASPPRKSSPGLRKPEILGDDTSTVRGGAGGDTTRAYFSPRPPSAPVWLVPLPAPLPAPLSAPPPAPLLTDGVLPDVYATPTTCEKESLTERNVSECREASVEASPPDTDLLAALRLSRSTAFSKHFLPPRNVAVQTQRNLRTTPSEESENWSLLCYDKSREWATRLRDGHVRLALRALRQLRRAERLHRALSRPAPHPAHPAHPAHPVCDVVEFNY